jgi:four helix bundle protein
MEKRIKSKSFTDLDVWQEGHKLALLVYKITDNFPSKEQFGLVSQLRRAAVSVTSNIAEGFNRNSLKEKINFYSFSRGSLAEIQNQILISRDIGFTKEDEFLKVADKTVIVLKLLNALISSIRKIENR